MKHNRLKWAAVLSVVMTVQAFAAKPPPAPLAPLPDISAIVGSPGGDWTCTTDRIGKPGRYTVRESQGMNVLVPEGPLVRLACPTEVVSGSEVTALVRLDNEVGLSTFKLSGGLTGVTNAPDGYVLALTAPAEGDSVGVAFRTAAQGVRESLAKNDYKTRWISKRGLGLPEDIRKTIEHQMASLPRPSQAWIRVRWQIREEGTRLYVDDRLLWQGGSNTAGRFSLELSKNAELALFRIAPLSAEKPGFEPIVLDGYLNAATLDGARFKPDGLPQPGGTREVGGVPFVRPRSDGKGNDHVDLEPSWLQNGFLGGRDSPRDGQFGGRWDGAWSVNPARLQFTIPPGRYSAIHLLAAADSETNSLPIVTAQFFIPEAGRPIQTASATVRRFTDPAGPTLRVPAKLDNGQAGNLFLITIPVEPGSLACFDSAIGLELTKGVRLYRAWPDPMFYSMHQAGLPSSVHVFAMTLEKPPVTLELKAANGLHVWTAPEKPVYIATLNAVKPGESALTLDMTTASYDGQEKTRQTTNLVLRYGQPQTVRFELALKKYGYHELTLALSEGTVFQRETRGLALLHPDTRERGNWERGRGALFGFWNWRGGHNTPAEPIPMTIMGMAGAESDNGAMDDRVTPEGKEAARKFGIKGFKAFGAGDHYITATFATDLQQFGLEVARSNFLVRLKDRYVKPDDLNRSMFLSFYAEPGIGLHTPGVPLSYDGLSETNDFVFTESEEARFQYFLNGIVEGAKIVNQYYPDVKCLVPHGDPGFPVPFLRRSAEARKLIDGVTVDIPVFEKMPESQMHQVALHRFYISREEFRKAGIPNPWLPMYEGPCLPTRPGSLTRDEHAALSVRDSLILVGYGVDFQAGGWSPFDAGSYWGEQHYGGGSSEPLPLATPRPTYAAYAAMTRNLNRRNFEKWVPTGSLSAYALQFKHYKDGSLMHTFWTLRGRRPVSVSVPAGAVVSVVDSMDNRVELPVREGAVTFTLGQAPCFVYGLPDSPKIVLGEPDHSDSAPAAGAIALGRLGDGAWVVSPERDFEYENSFKDFIRRYPAAMSIAPVADPAGQSGPALAVHLEKPATECRTMPYYTTLVPRKPIVIPGKASHLVLWVEAASDWGRVVYSVRDAKGERWLSVGTRGSWNCDDTHAWSAFNFDGRRYLRFELPACSPYDLFREAGSTWWGSYGKGDKIPDLPLTLEKIIVERRTHAMYVNDPQPASPKDVRLGGLFAEYETPADATPEAVRLSALRMPVPAGTPEMDNPIRDLETAGVGEAVSITNIIVPLHESDGTQCAIQFTTSSNAAEYQIWASPYPDGSGAVRMAEKVKEPGAAGARVRGFRPDTDFYLFVTYTQKATKAAKPSKPSKPFHINLKDTFAMK